MSEAKPAEKQVSKLPLWNCELTQVQEEQFTVGDKFEINCSGKETQLTSPLKIVYPQKTDEYKLVILNDESESTFSKNLIVSSYKPGNHAVHFEIHGSGGNKVQVIDFSYGVKSVIEKGKPPKEFGPYGPFELSFGWVFWALLTALLFALFGAFFFGIRGYFLRKEQMDNLASHKTSLSPFNQFNKDVRNLHKKGIDFNNHEQVKNRIDEIKKLFDLYLIRQFNVPALDWNSGKIVKKIKKENPSFYKRKGAKLNLALLEFKKAQIDFEKFDEHSFTVLIEILRERINEFEKDLNKSRLR